MSFVLLSVLVCVLTVAGIVFGDGNLVLAIGPALAFAVAYAVWKVPLRWPLMILMFCALTLENPADFPAMGQWKSPLYTVGALLLAHLTATLPYKSLQFSGLDVILVYFLVVIFWRQWVRSSIDGTSHVDAPRPLLLLAIASLAGAAWMWGYGSLLRGGADIASSLYQVERVIYLPVIFFAFQRALRPRDTASLAKVLVAAACLKACLAVYIHATVPPPRGETVLQYATTHPDSMLFAGAACIIVALLFEHRDRKHTLLALLILPVLVAGMVANERRLVWVELAAGVGVIFALTPRTALKVKLERLALLGSPLLLVYCRIGWNRASGVFRPVHTIRTLVDSDIDASTIWRDWENYDIVTTIRNSPLFGLGYGHGYTEYFKLPETGYALERVAPHNSILGLWAFGGLVGFTALWSMFVAGAFFGARAYRRAKNPNDRAAALAAVIAIVIYSVHCYGDLGLGTWNGVFTAAPALAVAGQLAVVTGAWPAREEALHLAPVPVPVRVVAREVTAPRKEAS